MRFDHRASPELQMELKVRKLIGSDQVMEKLLRASPSEVEDWISSNLTTVASVKALLIRLVPVISLLLRREFKEVRNAAGSYSKLGPPS